MTLLSICLLVIFLIYVYAALSLRVKKLGSRDKVAIAGYFLVTAMFYCIYFYNLYLFNDGQSISYGSDSSFFENIYKSMMLDGFDSYLYRFIELDNKSFTFVLFHPIYLLSDNHIVNGGIIFFINNSVYLLTVATLLTILNRTNAAYKSSWLHYMLIGLIPAPIVVFSFLRDVYVLFFIIEAIYAFYFVKPRILKAIIVISSLLALLFLRDFYFYTLIACFLLPLAGNSLIKKLALMILVVSIFAIGSSAGEFLNSLFGRLLMLTDSDIHMSKNVDLLVDIDLFYGGNYSSIELVYYTISRLAEGLYRFILTPIMSSYILYYFFDKPSLATIYSGFEVSLVNISYAFTYNFLYFPLLTSALISFRHNWKFFSNDQKDLINVLVVLILATISVYSIKFFGARNLKVDFIYSFLVVFALMYFRINRNHFVLGLCVMISLNIYILFRDY